MKKNLNGKIQNDNNVNGMNRLTLTYYVHLYIDENK